MLELSVLGGAAAVLAVAIWKRREIPLLAAVLAYAGSVNWLLQRDLGLLLPALGIAIAMGVVGIVLSLRAETETQKVTVSNKRVHIGTERVPQGDNIGL